MILFKLLFCQLNCEGLLQYYLSQPSVLGKIIEWFSVAENHLSWVVRWWMLQVDSTTYWTRVVNEQSHKYRRTANSTSSNPRVRCVVKLAKAKNLPTGGFHCYFWYLAPSAHQTFGCVEAGRAQVWPISLMMWAFHLVMPVRLERSTALHLEQVITVQR